MFKTIFDALCKFSNNCYARAIFTLCIAFNVFYSGEINLIVRGLIAVFLFVFGVGAVCSLFEYAECASKSDNGR